MSLGDRCPAPVNPRLIRVLENPVAFRVLELANKERPKSLSAKAITDRLKGDIAGLEVRQVAYQLIRLHEVGLRPRPLVCFRGQILRGR